MDQFKSLTRGMENRILVLELFSQKVITDMLVVLVQVISVTMCVENTLSEHCGSAEIRLVLRGAEVCRTQKYGAALFQRHGFPFRARGQRCRDRTLQKLLLANSSCNVL